MFPVFIAMGIAGTVASSQPFEYPKDRKGDVIDNYFGVKVPDPYRWLENVDSPETLQWINEENRLTQSYLRELPERDPFRDRLAKLLNFERYTVPILGRRPIYLSKK
jgi:prolyl oligopeptidase